MNAYQLSQILFPKDSSVLDRWIALGETNAYLRYLAAKGEISVYKEGKQYKFVRI
ncbi:hypothetical protein ACE198_00845 [Neobacillus sp. KR4-4]|uniref:hypothetical protein n=1 Tax=Neobacillus sp. KR4-4 TaxID=3344872 RepID=UPI0035CB1BAC